VEVLDVGLTQKFGRHGTIILEEEIYKNRTGQYKNRDFGMEHI